MPLQEEARPERHTLDRAAESGARGSHRLGANMSARWRASVKDDPSELEALAFLATPEWEVTRRIVASKRFTRSELLQKFLLHVCEMALRGRAADITEQRIGTQIFQRAPDYNPSEDNIVRSYARLLRKRLEDYFEDEGCDEPIRISIPRGGYVPVFEHQERETPAPEPTHDPAPPELLTEPSAEATPIGPPSRTDTRRTSHSLSRVLRNSRSADGWCRC